jgi:soluble lytic murein transglycosylase-like protein
MFEDEFYDPPYEIADAAEFYPEEDGLFDSSYGGWTPDPILIAGFTLVFGFLLWAILSKLTPLVFQAELSQLNLEAKSLAVQQTNQEPAQALNSSEQENQVNWNGECDVSTLFPKKITRWCSLITQYARKHNLDPDLVAALVWLESGGNEQAYSHSGAVGLMQVMPRDGLAASFMCANGPCFKDRPSSDELRNPEYNIAFGTRYLAGLIHRSGNLRDALRSYGPMDAGYTYSDKVLSIFNRYKL